MKAELINPFIKASTSVVSMMGGVNLEKGTPNLVDEVLLKNHIGIVIGITGEIRGQVVMAFDKEFAKGIISNMMGGMPVDTIDDIGKSAISELGNMVLGNAATGLYEYGYQIDITPPSLISGESTIYSTVGQKIVVIPFVTPLGVLELNISLKDRDEK